MLPDSIIIAQYLHGGTYSLRKFFNTHFPILFSKIVWALFGGPRGSCPLFSNSPSPATYPHIFSDVSTFYTNLHGGTYSLCKLSNTYISYHFSNLFSKFFWALFGGPGALAPIFEFPFSRYVSTYFFRRFDLFLTSLFTGLRPLMIIEPPDDRGQSPCLA